MTHAPEICAAKDGWFSLDPGAPHLLGQQCTSCGTFFFPPTARLCANPGCFNEEFEQVELSRTGTIWSYTSAGYPPPAPYIAADPFVPFGIVAVTLAKEQLVVLGQLASGYALDALKIGQNVELVLETLYEEDGTNVVVWKWKPSPDAEAHHVE